MPDELLDHRLLESFVQVAEARTISRGAARVHRTQSTVSAQIQRLEESAGVRLFERGARALRLTDEGSRLLEHAREILAANRRALTALRGELERTPARFGCSQYWRPRELPRIVAQTQRAFPDLALDFTVAQSAQLLRLLEAEELDVAVISQVGRAARGRLLQREPLCWVAAPSFRLPLGGPLPLVLLGGDCQLRTVALQALARIRRPARIVLQSTSAAGIVAALEVGLGVGCLNPGAIPDSLVRLDSPSLPPLPQIGFHAVQRRPHPTWQRLIAGFVERAG